MITPTLDQLKKEIEDLNGAPYDPDDETNRAALFLLSACCHGTTNADLISNLSDLPRSKCREFGKIARKYEVFIGHKINGLEWFDEESGGIAFLMDSMVLSKILEKKFQ